MLLKYIRQKLGLSFTLDSGKHFFRVVYILQNNGRTSYVMI